MQTGVGGGLHAAGTLVVYKLDTFLVLAGQLRDQLVDGLWIAAIIDEGEGPIVEGLLANALQGPFEEDGAVLGPHDNADGAHSV